MAHWRYRAIILKVALKIPYTKIRATILTKCTTLIPQSTHKFIVHLCKMHLYIQSAAIPHHLSNNSQNLQVLHTSTTHPISDESAVHPLLFVLCAYVGDLLLIAHTSVHCGDGIHPRSNGTATKGQSASLRPSCSFLFHEYTHTKHKLFEPNFLKRYVHVPAHPQPHTPTTKFVLW